MRSVEDLIGRMRAHNEWRRGGKGEPVCPIQLGADIDRMCDLLERHHNEMARIRAAMEKLIPATNIPVWAARVRVATLVEVLEIFDNAK